MKFDYRVLILIFFVLTKPNYNNGHLEIFWKMFEKRESETQNKQCMIKVYKTLSTLDWKIVIMGKKDPCRRISQVSSNLEQVVMFWLITINLVELEKKNFCSVARRGAKNSTWKNTVPPKQPISTWNDIIKVPAKLSNFLFTPISNIYFKKFSRFLYVFSQGWFDPRSYDQIAVMRICKQIRKLHLKLHLNWLHLKSMLKVETVTKSP